MVKQIDIEIFRSHRKTVAIEIRPNATVRVRAPFAMKDAEIRKFLKEKEGWILSHLERVEERRNASQNVEKLSMEEIRKLADQALQVIPVKVKHYATLMNLQNGRITIRNQKTRWGSCSGKGNLNFNCLLMLMPDEVVDYVVVHELCHLIEMNHSKAFWLQVEKVLPDYRERRKWLKEHGNEIMRRMYSETDKEIGGGVR